MRELPAPQPGGNIADLWRLVNIPEEDRPLVLAWLVEALRDGTPYPVLELVGEQGSAKSTTQRVLRAFVDPNKVALRAPPKTREDIFVSAGSAHVVSFENLSGLSAEYSDALCTIATGGGIASRLLYSNGEEHVIETRNPVMLNGIGAIVTRPDLLDRAIVATLPVITDRVTEGEHAALLEKLSPSIMGGLLDLFSDALRILPTIQIPPRELPRMADFAMLGEAVHRASGGEAGAFLALYTTHRAEAITRTIEGMPVAMACRLFVDSGHEHKGTVGALLTRLADFVDTKRLEKGDYWPKQARGLGDALRRAAPALRQLGIDCGVDPKSKKDDVHCWLRRDTTEKVNVVNVVNVESYCTDPTNKESPTAGNVHRPQTNAPNPTRFEL